MGTVKKYLLGCGVWYNFAWACVRLSVVRCGARACVVLRGRYCSLLARAKYFFRLKITVKFEELRQNPEKAPKIITVYLFSAFSINHSPFFIEKSLF